MNDIATIIPALNEEENILTVVEKLNESDLHNVIIAIDAATKDATESILVSNHIPHVKSLRTGYDATVQAGVSAINAYFPNSKYILFSDAGGKYSYEVVKIFRSEMDNAVDMVIGSRVEQREHMLWHQKLGTQMVLFPIRLIFHRQIEDISPFRLIRRDLYEKLNMQGAKFRFPSEMLIKCLALNCTVVEVPVKSLKRIGRSKVSGSIKNSLRAGVDMFSALQFIKYKTP